MDRAQRNSDSTPDIRGGGRSCRARGRCSTRWFWIWPAARSRLPTWASTSTSTLERHAWAIPVFEAEVRRTLARYGITPSRLVLEITETVPIVDLADAAVQIARLNALGVRVALDDFGAGYNSLTYLHALPVQTHQARPQSGGRCRARSGCRAVSLGHRIVRCTGPGRDRRGCRVDRAGREGRRRWVSSGAGPPLWAPDADRRRQLVIEVRRPTA